MIDCAAVAFLNRNCAGYNALLFAGWKLVFLVGVVFALMLLDRAPGLAGGLGLFGLGGT